jgi:hypothetical protein
MFLRVGSEPVSAGGMADGRLFETAGPQLAWPGGDATDNDQPPGSRARAFQVIRLTCSLPFGSIYRRLWLGEGWKEAHGVDYLLFIAALKPYNHLSPFSSLHRTCLVSFFGARKKFLKPWQYDQQAAEKLGRSVVTSCRNEIQRRGHYASHMLATSQVSAEHRESISESRRAYDS